MDIEDVKLGKAYKFAKRSHDIDRWIRILFVLIISLSMIGLASGCEQTDPGQTSAVNRNASPTPPSTTMTLPSTASTSTGTGTNSGASTSTGTGTSTGTSTSTGTGTNSGASFGAGDLTMLAINVGRADAILIQTAGRSFLIDTGTKDSVPQLIGALNLRGVRALDAVFLTHTHGDHTGGLGMLAQAFPIGMLYSAEISQPDKDGNNRISVLAKELSLKHALLNKGDSVAIAGSMAFEVIAPVVYIDADDNDNSLVMRLRANGRSILLAGDMQFAEEASLLKSGASLAADILKVGNHGNPDATSDEFAAAVSPVYAIISTDTDVDADSANARVLAALNGSHPMVTHDYPVGALLTIRADGSILPASPTAPPKTANVRIIAADPDNQAITIQNDGASVDLSGFFLISEKGPEVFVFPPNAALKQGQTAKVAGKDQAGDFHWQSDDKMWKGKKGNAFALYDRYGNELSRLDTGLGE